MNWKKILRITAVTLIPGGLVALGGWLVVKKLHSSHEAKRKSGPVPAQHGQEQAEKEA